MSKPLHIAIWGLGNLGSCLLDALVKHTSHKISAITSSEYKADNISAYNTLDALGQVDIIFLTQPDDLLATNASKAVHHANFVVHTSGSVPMIGLNGKGGVFYPFQTFTKGQDVDWSAIPLCIESEIEELHSMLTEIGMALSNRVINLSSSQRAMLHLVGVLGANFNNHLHYLIEQQLNAAMIDTSIVTPLLAQTQKKIKTIGAYKAQTGPARRGDAATIARHLKLLESNAELKELYVAFTRSIEATYK